MKKLLLLFVLLFSTMNYAQTEAVEKVSDVVQKTTEGVTTTERILDKYSSKAYDAVKELATALQVPAEHVYTILVRQALVDAISYLGAVIMLLIIGTLGLAFVYKNNDKFDWQYSPAGTFAYLGPSSIIILALITLVVNIPIIIGGFINPEYYVIKEVLDILK